MTDNNDRILDEVIVHLKNQKDRICKEWINKIIETGFLKKMNQEEISYEIMSIYDNTMQLLKTGRVIELQRYSRDLSERGVHRGIEISDIIGIILLLRDILARELLKKYGTDLKSLNDILNIYEPPANNFFITVATNFVQERERIIRHSTPLVEIWEKIILLPLIGILDQSRAKQVTEAILERIATDKTEVFVIDISGIASIDSQTIGYILRAIQAVRIMGADTIITGIRPDVATTIISLGIDVSSIITKSTLREGLDYAFSKLGLKVTKK